METKNYLRILKNDIHTTVMATVDENGHPATRVIDIMLADENTFYFITARGKEFYRQLMEQKFISVSGTCGGEGMDKKDASIHMKAVSICGTVRNLGKEKLEEVFRENPYMNRIYPTEASRMALEVFCMTEGSGEFFDLSTKPITRGSFVISCQGERMEKHEQPEPAKKSLRARLVDTGYHITDSCIGCKKCTEVCPQSCIDTETVPLRIRPEHCLHCGNCMTVCPAGAVKHV